MKFAWMPAVNEPPGRAYAGRMAGVPAARLARTPLPTVLTRLLPSPLSPVLLLATEDLGRRTKRLFH